MMGSRNMPRVFRNTTKRRSMSMLGGLGTLIGIGVVFNTLRNKKRDLG